MASDARRRLKRIAAVLVAAVVFEYVALPQLAGARHTLRVLGGVNVGWLALGVLLEAAAIASYAEITRTLLPPDARPSRLTLQRITMSTLGLSHVIPGGTAVGSSAGYRLLTNAGVTGTDAGFVIATEGIGSAVVLNALLWVGLVVSIPIRGFNPVYVSAAMVGAMLLAAVGIAVALLTKGEDHVSAFVCRVAGHVPFLDGNAVAEVLRRVATRLREIGSDETVLRRAITWAAANWLFDAASLWVFLAAFGHRTSPDALIISFGLAYVLAAVPLTPGGLGVVETVLTATLVGFGADRGVAVLGVVAYRLVNFWLPIPLGAVAYLTLLAGDRRPGELRRVAEEAEQTAPRPRQWARERGVRLPGGNQAD